MAEAALQSTRAEDSLQTRQSALPGREMGLGAVLIFAVSSIGLAYSGGFPFSMIAGQFAGSSLVTVIAVALAASLVFAVAFALMGVLIPRCGADYLLSSRVISAPLAFASSWTLMVFFSILAGVFVAYIPQSLTPMFTRVISLMLGSDRLVNSLSWVSTPNGVVLTGSVGVVIVFLLLVLPPKVTRRVLLAGFIALVMAWGVLYFQLSGMPSGGFESAWNVYMGEGSYQNHLQDALRQGMIANHAAAPAVSAGLLMCFWIFYGYFTPALVAGEVKQPERSLLLGSVGAVLLTGGLLVVGAALLQRQVPVEWIAAESYLSQVAQYQSKAMPWLPFYAAVLRPSAALTWLVAIAWVFTLLNMAHTFLYTASRVMFAWADDGLIPGEITAVHPVLRSPLLAILIVCILAEVGVADAGLNGSLLLRFNPLFLMAAVQVLPLVSLVLLPFRKPAWFEAAPPLVKVKIGRLPVISLLGGVGLLALIIITAANSAYHILGGIGLPSIGVFVVIFGLGLAWYYGRRYLLKSQGQDIDASVNEIP